MFGSYVYETFGRPESKNVVTTYDYFDYGDMAGTALALGLLVVLGLAGALAVLHYRGD